MNFKIPSTFSREIPVRFRSTDYDALVRPVTILKKHSLKNNRNLYIFRFFLNNDLMGLIIFFFKIKVVSKSTVILFSFSLILSPLYCYSIFIQHFHIDWREYFPKEGLISYPVAHYFNKTKQNKEIQTVQILIA